MGFISNVKTDIVVQSVSKAWDAGKPVCAVRLNVPGSDPGASGEIGVWSDMLAAIESVGWRLEHWSVSSDSKGRPEAYALFRR